MAYTEQSLPNFSNDGLTMSVLNYQAKFDSMVKAVKNNICELKTKFSVLETQPHISKTATNNLSKYIQFLERICHGMRDIGYSRDIRHSGGINDRAPEETVLNLYLNINAPIDSSNVEDCHHLKATNIEPPRVIVKLSKAKLFIES